MPRQIIHIAGVPVFLDDLPSGDLKVWHPYNDHTRAVIEPICAGNGYWNRSYNNWVIRENNKITVIAKIQELGAQK